MAGEARPIKSILSAAQQQLEAVSLDKREARLEARLLMQDVLGVTHAWLLAHENDVPHEQIAVKFESHLARRLAGEPIAYIIGHREFFGLDLSVSTDTLIPRPDTETLVEIALKFIPELIPENSACRVLDLGTGTGAIALAIASQRPHARICATDISDDALRVAIANAERHDIHNISFLQSDWFSNLGEEVFDLIVSNPPYIAEDDIHLSQGDLRFEPVSALASGKDGLDDIRKIIAKARLHLTPQGRLLLEHGYNQAEQIAGLLKEEGFSGVGHAKDLSGILRVTYARHA